MTFNTSEVAVCCSSDCRNSLSSRVLDSYDGLRGKVLDQFNLLASKWLHFLSVDRNCSNQLAVLEHRHKQMRPCPTQPC